MRTRTLLWITAASVAFQAALSAWALTQIPAGAQVPIHWGIDGRPDGYADALPALLFTPGITLLLGLLLAVVPTFDPRRGNLVRSSTAYLWICGSMLVFIAGLHVVLVVAALGNDVDVTRFIGVGIGALFAVIGNFLGKTRSSWFMGIRTPWTLSSELSWTRTHRLGGILFVAVGLITMFVSLVLPPEAFFLTLMIGILGSVVVLFAYSYFVWRDDPDRRAS
jgi:uncharacterized membrane protein